jgi:ArsR family transcriptional regulator, arsenate/arsenite/antimonite-responsive transcriptional repressor
MCVNMETMKRFKPTASCCSGLLSGQLKTDEATVLAGMFRVLGEPARLQMLNLIAAQPNQEVCACELVEPLGLAQPTISHHLKLMYEAGLLEKERRGTWIYYRIVPEQLELLRKALS